MRTQGPRVLRPGAHPNIDRATAWVSFPYHLNDSIAMRFQNGRVPLRFWVILIILYPLTNILTSTSDTIETFFDSRMDLLERQLKKHSERLKTRAEEAFKLKTPSGDIFAAKDLEREVQKFKLKVCIIF